MHGSYLLYAKDSLHCKQKIVYTVNKSSLHCKQKIVYTVNKSSFIQTPFQLAVVYETEAE